MEIDQPKTLIIADLTLDKEKYTLTQNSSIIQVTKKELKILWLLASNPNQVQSRQAIFDAAWEADTLVGSRTIDVHIRRLRSKIGEDYIQTVKGIGYCFNK